MSSPLKLRKISYFRCSVEDEVEELGKDDEAVSIPIKAIANALLLNIESLYIDLQTKTKKKKRKLNTTKEKIMKIN